MKTKSFQQYLSKRLSVDDIAHIEKHVKAEVKTLQALRQDYRQEPTLVFKNKK